MSENKINIKDVNKDTIKSLLGHIDENRVEHMLGVMKHGVGFISGYDIDLEKYKEDIELGLLLHDIGYFANLFIDTSKETLKDHNHLGYKVVEPLNNPIVSYMVYTHSVTIDSREAIIRKLQNDLEKIEPGIDWIIHEIVTIADMTTNRFGSKVTYTERILDIELRHGVNSEMLQAPMRAMEQLANKRKTFEMTKHKEME